MLLLKGVWISAFKKNKQKVLGLHEKGYFRHLKFTNRHPSPTPVCGLKVIRNPNKYIFLWFQISIKEETLSGITTPKP